MNSPISARPARRAAVLVLAAASLFAGSAYAACPVSSGSTTLVVRTPSGNLIVDTTGVSTVEVEVTAGTLQIHEVCGRDTIEIEGTATGPKREVGDWKIRVPRGVSLDLTTHGGNITVKGDSDGEVKLRTSGGAVMAGNIRRDALLVTQGGSIHVGNIGGNAELVSDGGNLDLGDVTGSATLKTASGVIHAGKIGGSVRAETGGGSITIRESRGAKLWATTKVGDIVVTGEAREVDARTEGGAITVGRARGAFLGHTDAGDIRVNLAQSSIDAYSGFGDIFIKMAPEAGPDVRVNIQTGNGAITFSLPDTMRASVEATVDKVAKITSGPPISSDFAMNSSASGGQQGKGFLPSSKSMSGVRGAPGGAQVKLRASVGSIQIRLTH